MYLHNVFLRQGDLRVVDVLDGWPEGVIQNVYIVKLVENTLRVGVQE